MPNKNTSHQQNTTQDAPNAPKAPDVPKTPSLSSVFTKKRIAYFVLGYIAFTLFTGFLMRLMTPSMSDYTNKGVSLSDLQFTLQSGIYDIQIRNNNLDAQSNNATDKTQGAKVAKVQSYTVVINERKLSSSVNKLKQSRTQKQTQQENQKTQQ